MRNEKKIGFQLLGDDNWLGGVYYVLNIINAILSLPENDRPKICLIVSPWIDKKHFDGLTNKIEILVFPSIESIEARHKFLHKIARKIRIKISPRYDYKYAKYLIKNGVDIIYPSLSSLSKNFPVKWVAWIPDLQHKELPENFSKKQIRDRDNTYLKLTQEAESIVFSSDDAKLMFNKYFKGNSKNQKTLHFRSIINVEWLKHDSNDILLKYNLRDISYFIISNQWWAHKNHMTAFKAIKKLKKKGVEVTIVCTGSTKDFRNKSFFNSVIRFINKNSLERNIIILGNIPRYDQIQLMRNAIAIIQPSLFEGWSTVVEDARTLNKKIILSNIKVNIEQNPPHAYYFSPTSHIEIADIIEKMIKFSDVEQTINSNTQIINNQKATEQYGHKIIRVLCEENLTS